MIDENSAKRLSTPEIGDRFHLSWFGAPGTVGTVHEIVGGEVVSFLLDKGILTSIHVSELVKAINDGNAVFLGRSLDSILGVKKLPDAVAMDRWVCCGKNRNAKYCPDCGRKRPSNSTLERALALSQEFLDKSTACLKKAHTLENSVEQLRVQHRPDELIPGDWMTWSDKISNLEGQAKASHAQSRRWATWAAVIREAIESIKTSE